MGIAFTVAIDIVPNNRAVSNLVSYNLVWNETHNYGIPVAIARTANQVAAAYITVSVLVLEWTHDFDVGISVLNEPMSASNSSCADTVVAGTKIFQTNGGVGRT